jgi:hypothetical protein
MAHGDAREGKWRGNWRMEWVASTLHTTSEHGVSSITIITTADAHTSAASSRLNWRPRRFKWTCPFRRKTKSGFCVCAITFRSLPISQKTADLIYFAAEAWNHNSRMDNAVLTAMTLQNFTKTRGITSVPIYINIHMRDCTHLERISLNINRKGISNKTWRQTRNKRFIPDSYFC